MPMNTTLAQLFRRTGNALAMTALLSLASCSNIKNDGNRTRAEGAAAGAALGAALGAGMGALGKKGKKGMVGGAALGAVLGGLAGGAYGDSVAKKKEGYTRTEGALDARIATVRQETATRRSYNVALRSEVSRRERQLAAVLASEEPPGSTVEEFDLRSSVATKLRETEQKARSWHDTIIAHKAALQQAGSTASAEAEVNALADERGALLRSRERLLSIGEKLKR